MPPVQITDRHNSGPDAPRPAYSPPTEQVLDLLFGMALMQQGFTGEQAAAYLRRAQVARARAVKKS